MSPHKCNAITPDRTLKIFVALNRSSPRRSSLGLWWRASPPVPFPFYTRTSPENSSTGPYQSSAALWCNLCLWSCRSSSTPRERERLRYMHLHYCTLLKKTEFLYCVVILWVSYFRLSNNEGCFGPQGGKDACHLHCNITCTHNHTAPVGGETKPFIIGPNFAQDKY